MNIANAKKHLLSTIKAYLAKDEDGMNLIEAEKQRPLFLLGAPGIGKTAIMSQVARELGVGLVSYSMTHHTRQSALGLPFIVDHDFEGFEYRASEYTMSEIVASIYDYMAETGLRQGILFLDEINCVSETLYPSMLQFLQFKTFGRHKVPEGWVVVCAGNPQEYNKSVHEFDIVTMDRLRRVDVEPEFDAWRAYAADRGVHPAVITYLDNKRENFYRVESTPQGKRFVTARGWDDLARAITTFENLDEAVDLDLIGQFVQDDEIAESFALYYELFRKYRSDYQVDAILAGQASQEIVDRAAAAPFDERLALLGLLVDALARQTGSVLELDALLVKIRDFLRGAKSSILEGASAVDVLSQEISDATAVMDKMKSREADAADIRAARRELALLKTLREKVMLSGATTGAESFEVIHQEFRGSVGELESSLAAARSALDAAFAFVDAAFGNDREMLVFVTELTARRSLSTFISRFGCDAYYAYSAGMSGDDRQRGLLNEIDDAWDLIEPAKDATPTARGLMDERIGDEELANYYANANFEYGYASLCHMALPGNLKGKKVLDIGCRRGKGVFKLSDKVGQDGFAIGIDWTPDHINEAAQRAPRAARDTGYSRCNMEFHLCYPEDLVSVGIGDSTLDVVFINSVMHLTADPARVMAEAYRVLKPGGTMVCEIALADKSRDAEVVAQARKLGNSIQAAPGKNDFEALATQIGFSSIDMIESKPVDCATGYKFDHKVETAPSNEGVSFEATVLHLTK